MEITEERLLSVKLHLRDKRTDGQMDRDTSLSRCPLCLSGASILWVRERSASDSDKFKGEGQKFGINQ